MTDYKKYINALRKCAKEHENDRTSTGHIIVSDLCRDTANLLEALEQEPIDKSAMMCEIYMEGVNMGGEYQGCWVRFKDIEKIVDKYMGDKE